LGPTVATLSLGANATMNFRPKKKTNIPSLDEGNARGKKDKTEKSSILSIKLEHGDIVIMHGREIQKLYEVSNSCLIVPTDLRKLYWTQRNYLSRGMS
jgi:alkylated DNA repair dioxygenase AlkB